VLSDDEADRIEKLSARLSDDEIERLARKEHERWLKAKIQDRWSWAAKTNKENRKHQDLLLWDSKSDEERVKFIASSLLSKSEFANWQNKADEELAKLLPNMSKVLGPGELPEKEKEKNRDMVRDIPKILAKAGYRIIRIQHDQASGST
jgi:hypothetical protein